MKTADKNEMAINELVLISKGNKEKKIKLIPSIARKYKINIKTIKKIIRIHNQK